MPIANLLKWLTKGRGESGAPVSHARPIIVQFGPESTTISLERIKSIGIENITDLQSYNMSETDGRVMHVIEFVGGGVCEVTYLLNGRLEVFNSEGVTYSIREGVHVLLKKARP